jgi:HlyD family secretion protein
VGRIDGDLITLNTKYPGRLESISVEDGAKVHKGMVIATLKSREQEAQKEQIVAQIKAQEKMLEAKEKEADISKKTIPLVLEKAKNQLASALAEMKALKSQIVVQEELLKQAERDFKRSRFLYKSKTIDTRSFELAKLQADTEKRKLNAQKEKLKVAEAAVNLARSSLKEAQASQEKLDAIALQIDSVKDGIDALRASKKQIEALLSEMTLKSPVNGYCLEKIANSGEIVGSGMPVATLLDPHSLYLKIFVDTIQNGKIKIGDKAVIFLDAYPNRPIEAKVVRIAQKAEFTPKEVSVRSDRIQRVFAVHIKPLEPNPLLKLGIPAIGVVSIDGKGLPSSLDDIPAL